MLMIQEVISAWVDIFLSIKVILTEYFVYFIIAVILIYISYKINQKRQALIRYNNLLENRIINFNRLLEVNNQNFQDEINELKQKIKHQKKIRYIVKYLLILCIAISFPAILLVIFVYLDFSKLILILGIPIYIIVSVRNIYKNQ